MILYQGYLELADHNIRKARNRTVGFGNFKCSENNILAWLVISMQMNREMIMFSIAEAKKNCITKHQENVTKIKDQPVIKKKVT